MKRPANKVAMQLNANNEASLLERVQEKSFKDTYIDFLQLVAQAFDKAIEGENVYLNVGMTRDRSGLLVVINWDGDKSYLVAGSLASLSQEAQHWIAD